MKPYLQTTEYTCAASALLMILNHFNKDFELSRENEFHIWKTTANLPVRASSIYGLAVFAKKNGLHPQIILGEKEYDFPDYRFKRYTKKDIDDARFTSRIYHKEAVNLGIPIQEKEFTLEDVKKLLEQGRIIMLRLNAGVLRDTRSTSNYVVVYNYKNKFHVIDPKQGKLIVADNILEEAFSTLQTKKKRDHRMIVF